VVCSAGNVPDDQAVATFLDLSLCEISPTITNDTVSFPLYRDRIFDEDGDETHMFWRAAPSDDFETGVRSKLLATATGYNEDGTPATHTETIVLGNPSFDGRITRVTIRMKMRPMDFDVLEELVDAQVLDASILDEVRTFTLDNASIDFVRDPVSKLFEVVSASERDTDCSKVFLCAVDPDATECDD
jgi:hypothetical protein